MLRTFFTEYKNGVIASLKGFAMLPQLINLENAETKETRQPSNERSTPMTVLERRRNQRQSESEKPVGKAPKPTRRSNRTMRNLGKCVSVNIALVLTIFFLGHSVSVPETVKYYGETIMMVPVALMRLASMILSADVANSALRLRRPRSRSPNVPRMISDFVHAIFLELIFLQQINFIKWLDIPLFSRLLSLFGTCQLNAMYSFDYAWMANEIVMHRRVAYLDNRWAYHLGFGTLLTTVTAFFESSLVNDLIFGAIFPIFIISGCVADPLQSTGKPADPLPEIPVFYPAQVITNKLSMAIFKLLSKSIKLHVPLPAKPIDSSTNREIKQSS